MDVRAYAQVFERTLDLLKLHYPEVLPRSITYPDRANKPPRLRALFTSAEKYNARRAISNFEIALTCFQERGREEEFLGQLKRLHTVWAEGSQIIDGLEQAGFQFEKPDVLRNLFTRARREVCDEVACQIKALAGAGKSNKLAV